MAIFKRTIPYPRHHAINNFGRYFLSHHNYALSLSVLCLR